MLIGKTLPTTIFDDWRFVDGDMYDIAKRVIEYDRLSRLVVQDETMHLGLARSVANTPFAFTGMWMVACRFYDEDGAPLTGEPDHRVLKGQREMDTWKAKNPKAWREKMRADKEREEAARKRIRREMHQEQANEYVMLFSKRHGAGRPVSLYVPQSVAREREKVV